MWQGRQPNERRESLFYIVGALYFHRSVSLKLHNKLFDSDTLLKNALLVSRLNELSSLSTEWKRELELEQRLRFTFVCPVYTSIVVSYDCVHGNILTRGKLTEDDRIASQVTKPRFYPTLSFVVVSLKAD